MRCQQRALEGGMVGYRAENPRILGEDPPGGCQDHGVADRSPTLEFDGAGCEVAGEVQERDHPDRGDARDRGAADRPCRQPASEAYSLCVVGDDDDDGCERVAVLERGNRLGEGGRRRLPVVRPDDLRRRHQN